MTIERLKPFDNVHAVYFVCHLCKQASALSTQNGIFDHLVQHSLHTSSSFSGLYREGAGRMCTVQVAQEFHSVVFLTTISFALFLKLISQFSGYYDPSSSEASVAWCPPPWCMLHVLKRTTIPCRDLGNARRPSLVTLDVILNDFGWRPLRPSTASLT
ncbi:hypothetical protein T02_15226 [Trichinella nativa]|uniref:Uncharacterized protein n=1 Tax=Trichinella nativa TaxID=6335 RepID=A0A0V1L666_9BILA|nr:hypothetical protein T02_15226 [Trichinella nativa]